MFNFFYFLHLHVCSFYFFASLGPSIYDTVFERMFTSRCRHYKTVHDHSFVGQMQHETIAAYPSNSKYLPFKQQMLTFQTVDTYPSNNRYLPFKQYILTLQTTTNYHSNNNTFLSQQQLITLPTAPLFNNSRLFFQLKPYQKRSFTPAPSTGQLCEKVYYYLPVKSL